MQSETTKIILVKWVLPFAIVWLTDVDRKMFYGRLFVYGK